MITASIFRDHGRRGLLANAGAFTATCLATNGLIFGLGWNAESSAGTVPLIPPGPVVGVVWTMLFAGMGTARWAYLRDAGERGWQRHVPTALAAVCLAFPFYTAGLSDERVGYVGTVATFGATVVAAAALWERSRLASGLILPTAIWTGWVSLVGAVFGRI
jgi:tryptophan-rich sensory protein